jgi:hypothetical protein
MPLSFLASFFALNVDGFPRSVDGGVEFGLPWVAGLICKLTFLSISLSFASLLTLSIVGVTAAFVVPFVIGAFFFVAPSGREQARNLLRHLFKLFTSPGFWLTARFREHRVTKVSRRRSGTSLEAEGWNTVTYEPPSSV